MSAHLASSWRRVFISHIGLVVVMAVKPAGGGETASRIKSCLEQLQQAAAYISQAAFILGELA